MKKILFFIILGTSLHATASFTDACALENVPLPDSATYKQEVVAGYKQKLASECYLQKRFVKAKNTVQSSYGANLEDMTIYRALRFVSRPYYEGAKNSNLPMALVFQTKKSNYDLPVEKRSTEVWENWKAGILQLDSWVAKIKAGEVITLSDLKNTHKGFYTVSDERGDFANAPEIGKIKPPNSADGHWFKIEPADDVARIRNIVDVINLRYKEMDLLPAFDYDEVDAHLPLHIRNKNDGAYIYGGDTRLNSQHLDNLFNFMNEMIQQGLQGKHMIWHGRLMTPGEVALFAQQLFVHIHPFNDGNGRLSRLLQESILEVFNLPFLSSGDLMSIDVLTTHENYYYIAMGKTFEQFDRIETCVNEVYPRLKVNAGGLKTVAPSKIEYDCRLLD